MIQELGFDAIDAGPLMEARILEPFALLWISLGIKPDTAGKSGFILCDRALRPSRADSRMFALAIKLPRRFA